jgi:hypothetical protein
VADLPVQFERAKTNVEPTTDDKTNAAEAHSDLRAHLEGDGELKELGVDTILIGSYKRQVSIRRVKDVDAFCKLMELPEDADPAGLLATFETILTREYGADQVECQDRSIKVEFPDYDLHVDAVPARPVGDYWEVPDPEGGWQETNPEQLGVLTTEMNDRYEERYVPVVKLIRQARRANLGDDRPGGLYLEILTYHAFDGDLDASSLATLFTAALRSIASQLAAITAGGDLGDPTRPGKNISARVSDAELVVAASTFAALATKAEEALADDDRCRAAKKFREILGKNADDEWVFEMPADCNDDGTARKVAVLLPGDRNVPAGDGRFA